MRDAVFELGQRVELRQQRHAPALLELPRRRHRKPVVRVDEVIAAAVKQAVTLHAAGELGEVVEDVVLVEASTRSGVEMDYSRARRKLDDIRGVVLLAPGEYVNGDSARG